jgi:hypothetical protein
MHELVRSAPSSVRTKQAWTPPVVNLPHDIDLHTGFTRKEENMEDHEWQAQRIMGERQTPSGLEYEVSLEKTLWLPKGRRRSTRNWCGGTERGGGQRPESARGGRRGYRKRAAR